MTNRPLLLDEMLSGTIAGQLRDRGHDVLAVVDDPTLIGLPDDELLERATREDRALGTLNIGDFAKLASTWRARGRTHAGIVFVPTATFPQDRRFVDAMVASLSLALADNELLSPGTEMFLSRSASS